MESEPRKPFAWLGVITEIIAASSALAIATSIVFNIAYLFGLGQPEAISHFSIGDYVDSSAVAVIGVVLPAALAMAALEGLSVRTLLKREWFRTAFKWNSTLSGIGLIIGCSVTTYFSGWRWFNLPIYGLGVATIILGRNLASRSIRAETAELGRPRAATLAVAALALVSQVVFFGTFFGGIRRICPHSATIELKEKAGDKIEGFEIVRLEKEFLLYSKIRTDVQFGVPSENIASHSVTAEACDRSKMLWPF